MFEFIKKLFIKEVIVPVFPSELSNPTKCVRVRNTELELCHIKVLNTIRSNKWVKASELDRIYNSWWRRANELFHRGYVDNIGNKHIMRYAINDKWLKFLNSL